MKNRILTLGAAILLLASCSSDDDTKIEYDKLTQKWYFVSERVGGETFPYEDHEDCGKDYIQFLTDNSVRYVDVYGCEADEPLETVQEATWTRNGKTITVQTFAGSQELVIQKLTTSTLEIKSVYDYDEDGDDETVIERYTNNPN
ncbi:MAG TPA: lipocalin family protein [Flavobacterium sp.]|jgi:hypothetical protein